MKMIDLTGMKFGNLLVLGLDSDRRDEDIIRRSNGDIPRVRLHWICRCLECGNITSVQGDNLKSGQTKDCGCVSKKTRGFALKKENEFIFDGDQCVIIAANTHNKFFIDISDYDMVKQYCWHETEYGYLASRANEIKRIILLHRMLVFGIDDIDNTMQVDHINRNKRDCRRSNLRVCTPLENSRNKSIDPRNSSGRTGVSYDRFTKKWRAYVNVERSFISLGYYNSFEEAAAARENGEKVYYGKYAPTN